jgi:hypothetical protein
MSGLATNSVQPLVFLGTGQDVNYNATGGASVNAGPFTTTGLRLALAASDSVRFLIGGSSVAAVATSSLFVGPGVEFVPIPIGAYIAFLGNTASTGTINITPVIV